jgi:hypothetical protein
MRGLPIKMHLKVSSKRLNTNEGKWLDTFLIFFVVDEKKFFKQTSMNTLYKWRFIKIVFKNTKSKSFYLILSKNL